jgi:hypothetical protein
MRKLFLCLLIVLASCVPTITPQPPTVVPPTAVPPTPFVSPITPTPFVSPVPKAETPVPLRVITATVKNYNFEGAFVHPFPDVQEFTVGKDWTPWWVDRSPCIAGDAGCIIPKCPKNCQKADGTCPSNSSCWWMRPELKAAYKPDVVGGIRVFEGLWSQYGFSVGRMAQDGFYQRVFVGAGNRITATIMALSWQCFSADDCRYSHMSPEQQAKLRAAWGITRTVNCPGDEVCKWPASDVPSLLASTNPRKGEPDPTMWMKLGIDPTGTFTGTQWSGDYYDDGQKVWLAPYFGNVVWGQVHDSWDIFSKYTASATAQSDYVTIIWHTFPQWEYAYWNNDWSAELVQVTVQEKELFKLYLPQVRK